MAVGAALAPPGFRGPAALPTATALPNDAPPTSAEPYLICQGYATGTSTNVTVPVRTPTGTGDAILVFGAANGNVISGASDTKNNSYVSVAGQLVTFGLPCGVYIARNPAPLTTSDTISCTWPSNNSVKDLVAIGVPLGAFAHVFPNVPGGGHLTYDTTTTFFGGVATGYTSIAPGIAQPELVVCFFINGTGVGAGPQIGQDWTVCASFYDNTQNYVVVAYKYVTKNTAGTALAWSLQPAAGHSFIAEVGLYPETRFAPKPVPDMAPGLQSPGAWQYKPAFNAPGALFADADAFTGTGSMALAADVITASDTETFTSAGSLALEGLDMFGEGGNYQVNSTGSMALGNLGTFGRYKPPQGVTGWDLYSTLQQQAAYAEYYKTTLPMACPNDGEPLREGPPSMSGVLYCPYDGFQYPRDWDAETMSGM